MESTSDDEKTKKKRIPVLPSNRCHIDLLIDLLT